MTKQAELPEEQACQNPSYDKSLSVEQRVGDFLGAYHVVLNGVVAHDPYVLSDEDGDGMCCQDSKKRIVEFVELLVSQAQQEAVERERERIMRFFDKYNPVLVQQVKKEQNDQNNL